MLSFKLFVLEIEGNITFIDDVRRDARLSYDVKRGVTETI